MVLAVDGACLMRLAAMCLSICQAWYCSLFMSSFNNLQYLERTDCTLYFWTDLETPEQQGCEQWTHE